MPWDSFCFISLSLDIKAVSGLGSVQEVSNDLNDTIDLNDRLFRLHSLLTVTIVIALPIDLLIRIIHYLVVAIAPVDRVHA